MSTSDVIVGIDLGTTFSLVAYADERGPQLIRDEDGDGRLPSVIGVIPAGPGETPVINVGWSARNHAVENPRATVYSIKRLIGKGLADIERELPFLAYAVRPGLRETLQVVIDGQPYTPEEISAVILRTLRKRAETHLKRPVRRAVITVPAYFDDAQRQATRLAGEAAGLEVVRIINEPTAAALAYGLGLRAAARNQSFESALDAGAGGSAEQSNTAAGPIRLPMRSCHESSGVDQPARADLDNAAGGETVAVYDLGGGTFDVSILRIEQGVFQVLSTAGDTHLGGDDFDRVIITLVQREVEAQFHLQIDTPTIKQALRSFAEQVKVRLTDYSQATLELDLGAGRTYRREIAREEFERLSAALVDRTFAACAQALGDARLTAAQLDRVILVGGATRMPAIRRRVAEFFGIEPYTALNPDEVVAIGAAIQASILAGAPLDMLLLDVTPLSLGIETLGGAMGKLIMRNSAIPCRAVEHFTTFVDGQTAIRLTVLQGERELARDCRKLAEFELRDLPPMPAGIPKLEVAFLLDANGILNVSARETRSGRAAGIQVIPNHGLTREEVTRVMQESLLHARQDIDAHRRIDLLNQVQFDTVKAEQMLALHGARLEPSERARIEREIAELRAAAPAIKDLDALHARLSEFGRSTLRLAEIGIREALRTSPK